MPGAAGWQLSNAQIFSFAAHKASLDIFAAAGMPALREKSLRLTGYLEWLIDQLNEEDHNYRIITPRNPKDRGCQLSILTGSNGRELFDYLTGHGVILDWREPNVIRVAPVPLYNTFQDVYEFAMLLKAFGRK